MAVTGGETGIVEGVMQSVNTEAIPIETGAGQYTFSSDGTLAFVAGDLHPDFEGVLLWMLRNGSIELIAVPPPSRPYFGRRSSPPMDGAWPSGR